MDNMMIVSTEMKDKVVSKIEECMFVAEVKLGRRFDFPNIVYKKRGTTAGTACSHTYTIDINAVLLMENGDTFINRTVVHEFAHLVDAILHPKTRNGLGNRSVHGPTWKRIMGVFGVEANRCHSYDVTNARTRKVSKYIWTCKCGKQMHLGTIRHAKMLNDKCKYYMSGCNTHGGYTYGEN
jgi:SprT protein